MLFIGDGKALDIVKLLFFNDTKSLLFSFSSNVLKSHLPEQFMPLQFCLPYSCSK